MKEFFKRLSQVLRGWGVAVVASMVLLLVLGLIGGVIILLPIWLLSYVIGDLAAWWLILVFVVVGTCAEWENIKRKFIWLFIEPFSKKTKLNKEEYED